MRYIDERRRALIAAARQGGGVYLGEEFSFPYAITNSNQMVGAMPGLPLGSADTLTILKSATSNPYRLFIISRLSSNSDYVLRTESNNVTYYTRNDASINIYTSFKLSLVDLTDPRISSFPGFVTSSRLVNAEQIAAFIRSCVTVDRPTIIFVPQRFADIENKGLVIGCITPNKYVMIRKDGSVEKVTTGGTAFDYFVPAGGKICVYQPEITGG